MCTGSHLPRYELICQWVENKFTKMAELRTIFNDKKKYMIYSKNFRSLASLDLKVLMTILEPAE